MDFPSAHFKVDAGIGEHTRKTLDDVAHFHFLDAGREVGW
jgi:hypothetical protein